MDEDHDLDPTGSRRSPLFDREGGISPLYREDIPFHVCCRQAELVGDTSRLQIRVARR